MFELTGHQRGDAGHFAEHVTHGSGVISTGRQGAVGVIQVHPSATDREFGKVEADKAVGFAQHAGFR